jgi:hypothetical protein
MLRHVGKRTAIDAKDAEIGEMGVACEVDHFERMALQFLQHRDLLRRWTTKPYKAKHRRRDVENDTTPQGGIDPPQRSRKNK